MKRRDFVKKIAGAGALIGFPTLIPARALGRDGNVAPSERLTLGSIGLGGMGIGNTHTFVGDKRVQLVALCDVNNSEGKQFYGYGNNETFGLREAAKRFGADIPQFNDFRELLAKPDIDIITTATPDHWHALIGIACVRAGKDVHGEKPLTRTIREGQALRDAVWGSGRIWQTGSWQRSMEHFKRAAEIIRNGNLGQVKRVVIGLPSNFKAESLDEVPVPAGMDWEMWQGPAMRTFYNPRKIFTRWRGISNYCAGKISDWGAHHLDITHWALGFDNWGPDEIVPNSVTWPTDGFSDQPLKFSVTLYYKGGIEVEISDSNRNGVEFFGTKGKLFVSRENIFSDPINIADIRIFPTEDRLYPIRRDNAHVSAFIDSVLDRRATATDIGVAHRTNTGCLLAEMAYRLNRPIKWDPKTETVIGDEEAARLCDRAYHAPWELSI